MTRLTPAFVAIAAVVTSAVLWGLSGTAAQVLFHTYDVTPAWLVGVRMSAAGVILIVALRPRVPRQDWGQLVVFGLIGLAAVQWTYYAAIADSNVATATFLQYLGPAFLAVFILVTTGRLPRLRTAAALVVALGGTLLLALAGRGADMSPGALAFGLTSAAALAFYTAYPEKLVARRGTWPVTAWGLVIGGVALEAVHPVWAMPPVPLTGSAWILVAFVTVFGTLIPFGLYLYGLKALPPTELMILATLEPVAAAISILVFLGQALSLQAYLGGALVVVAVAVLATGPLLRRHEDAKAPDR